MTAVSTSTGQIREQVVTYLDTPMSVADLSDWMDLHTLGLAPGQAPEAYALSRDVLDLIVRFEDAEISEPDLVAGLVGLLGRRSSLSGLPAGE